LGERLLCKQEVIGSIPFTSTTDQNAAAQRFVSPATGATQVAPRAAGCEQRLFDMNDASFGLDSGEDGLPAALRGRFDL
jgi:hypothetical protein